jgi:arylsulfatase
VKNKDQSGVLSMMLCVALTPLAMAQISDVKIDRTVLPIAEPDYPRSTVLDARDAKPPPRFEIKAPAGAPNVLIVLVDDMGFGMPSAFGGPHDGALLAHEDGPAFRSQSPHE